MRESTHCFIPGVNPDKQQIANQTRKVHQAESWTQLFHFEKVQSSVQTLNETVQRNQWHQRIVLINNQGRFNCCIFILTSQLSPCEETSSSTFIKVTLCFLLHPPIYYWNIHSQCLPAGRPVCFSAQKRGPCLNPLLV